MLSCSSKMCDYYLFFLASRKKRNCAWSWDIPGSSLAAFSSHFWSAGRKAVLRVQWIKKREEGLVHAPQIWCNFVISPCLSDPYLFIHPHASSTCHVSSFPFFYLNLTNPAAGGATPLPRVSTKNIWKPRGCWQVTTWINAEVKVVFLAMDHTHMDRNVTNAGL